MPDFVPNCPLCSPARGVVLDNDHWTLILNENQATLGRVFFALKRHETDVAALTSDEITSLWAFLREAKAALTALFAPDHFNYMFLMNLTPHAHFHIFPRYKDVREFAGQTWMDGQYGDHYDPQENRAVDDATMNALAAALRHEITQPTGGKP
ncbi:MAG: HIT family protein [Armatimonadota bacterium]|nr:HIT family protein [Armatimonadota bacterium]